MLKHLGNFPQFFKEELYSFAHVLWIGYCGACIIVFLNLKDKPDILNNLLPIYDPPKGDPGKPPYYMDDEARKNIGMLQYLFSYKSDFPYNIRKKNPVTDEYTTFFGGMVRQLYSTYRFMLKYMILKLDADNYLINAFSFYLLPSILYYAIFTISIPVSFFGINLFSCFSQINFAHPATYAFAAFLNPFNFIGEGHLISDTINYIRSILFGCFITFFALPSVSLVSSLSVWVYLLLLTQLLPLFIIFVGGMDAVSCIKQIITQIIYHRIGLCAIFLFYSISIAYKNFNKPIAFGVHLGIVIAILLLLNVFIILKNTIMSLISGNIFKIITDWLYRVC